LYLRKTDLIQRYEAKITKIVVKGYGNGSFHQNEEAKLLEQGIPLPHGLVCVNTRKARRTPVIRSSTDKKPIADTTIYNGMNRNKYVFNRPPGESVSAR
jgi:hypothetical protein